MKRKAALVGIITLMGGALALAAGTVGWYLHLFFGKERVFAAAPAKTPAEARILATLRQMESTGQIEFGVPESDGRRLRLLAEASGARNVVEVGTSTGYSALWLCLGVQPGGGHVTTFEVDRRRAAVARENFRRAGLNGEITVIEGDAHKNLPALKGPVDLVFLDADKEGYIDYLNTLLPLMRAGGMILAHNVEQAPDYVRRVTADPQLETVFLTQRSGLSVTLKKR